MTGMLPTIPKNALNFWVKVTVTKPVWSNVVRLCEILETYNLTDRRNGHRYPYRETKLVFQYSETLKGTALPSSKRLRAGRCKGCPAYPTALYGTGGEIN
jgi:hypothetical protein